MSGLSLLFGHRVQGTSILEPLDLGFVEGVGERDIICFTVLGVDTERDGLADSKLSAEEVDSVIGVELIVVLRVGEVTKERTAIEKRQQRLRLRRKLIPAALKPDLPVFDAVATYVAYRRNRPSGDQLFAKRELALLVRNNSFSSPSPLASF